MSQFLVITGLSGAGRSQAGDALEDLGWFVIDNLPPALMSRVADLATHPGSAVERVGLVVGTGPYHSEVLPSLQELRTAGHQVRILFLDCSTDVLVRRYTSSRRRHPVEGEEPLAETIERERELLDDVKAAADVVIDTSELNVHELRRRLVELFGHNDPAAGMQVLVESFGYKHGLPLDVDLVLDCRFLPNPHWIEELRPLTGLDEPVRDYVLGQAETGAFLDRLDELLELLLPAFVREGKSYLTIAFGCTGGRHRSVAIAEDVAGRLRRRGFEPAVHHRDLDR